MPWPADFPSGWPTSRTDDSEEKPNVREDDELYGWTVVDYKDPDTPVVRTKAWVTSDG